ncbi:MAG: glycosyltransferase, partial [Chloroflexota bacterium]
PLADLAPSTQFVGIGFEPEAGWVSFNPSIAADGDRWRAILRTSNYDLRDGAYVTEDADGPIRTRNYLAEFDENLNLVSARPLSDAISDSRRTGFPVHGFEDCRLIRWQDRWHAVATARDLNAAGICQQVLLRLDGDGFDELLPLSNPDSGFHEKNWMPLDLDGNLLLVYSVSPLVVVRFDPVSEGVGVVREAAGPRILAAARGGSQLVRFGEGWLAVVHESVEFDDGGRSYPHRFVWFNDNLDPVLLSPQFHFFERGIEYCTGLAMRGDTLVVSFGSEDASGHFAVAQAAEILSLLAPPIDVATHDASMLFAAAGELARAGNTAAEESGAASGEARGDSLSLEPEPAPGGEAGQVTQWDDGVAPEPGAAEAGSAGEATGWSTAGAPVGASAQPASPEAAPAGYIEGLTHGQQTMRAATFTPFGRPVRIVSTTITASSEHVIGDALRSVVDLVDACVVIDTGVRDRAIDIAREVAGDKLIVRAFLWTGSFSDARNFALAAAAEAGGDWAVTLDTDERIEIDPESLRDLLVTTEAGLLHLRYEDGSYGKERFFRLPVRGEFVGPTHEAFVGDVLVLDVPGGHFSEVPKDEAAYQQKFERDIEILARYVVDHPEDPRWRYYLGDALQNAGRLPEAIEQFQACWDLNGWDEESAWSMYRAAECQIALAEYDAAIQSCANGLVRHPGIAELPWLASWACYRQGQFRRAIAWARMSCAIGSVEGIGDSFPRLGYTNPRGRYEGPYDVLRFALRELGENDAADAAEYLFDEALAMRGSSREQEEG